MNIPASTILALTLAGGFVAFIIIRAITRCAKSDQKSKNKPAVKSKGKRKELSEKEAALAKFKQVHAAARDNRKKIAKEVKQNPQKATQALRSMMKR